MGEDGGIGVVSMIAVICGIIGIFIASIYLGIAALVIAFLAWGLKDEQQVVDKVARAIAIILGAADVLVPIIIIEMIKDLLWR